MKGSQKSQIFYLLKLLDGIKKSKKEYRKNSNEVGQNGHNVSPLIHSFKYRSDVKNTAHQLLKYANEKYNVKDFEKVNNEIVYEFLSEKINKGLKFRTISTYIGHLQKIHLGLKKIAELKEKKYKAFDENGLKNVTDLKKKKAQKSMYRNRAYTDVERIISNFSNENNRLVARLQIDVGVRVAEGLRFKPSQFKPDNFVEIKIKGGNKILVKVSKKLYAELKTKTLQAVESGLIGLKINYNDYYKDFKMAVKMSNEEWTGTHGLRYVYAQCRMDELSLQKEITYEEARLIVSQEMGHKRAKITSHYLG